MDKKGLLITRLLELYNKNANIEQLRITTQLLLSELENEQEKERYYPSVSVFFPASNRISFANDDEDVAVETTLETEAPVAKITPEPKVTEVEIKPGKKPDKKSEEEPGFFNPMIEIPTLALKQQEVNETIAAKQESLNDKLKSTASKKEIAHNIADGPIKDLRKAIGINDQYLFINELFRGDQVMYDRSIKTINGFNIFGEAELWIKRELKLKLGWNEKSDVVHLFDQLVKRRFA